MSPPTKEIRNQRNKRSNKVRETATVQVSEYEMKISNEKKQTMDRRKYMIS